MTKKKILIVDDEQVLTHMIRLILEKTDAYDVREENKPQAALATAREFRPDLILLDVIMPGMDGGELAAKIKADPELSHVQIVFLTAAVPKRETATGGGLMSGGYLFLSKPVGIKDLLQCIDSSLATQKKS